LHEEQLIEKLLHEQTSITTTDEKTNFQSNTPILNKNEIDFDKFNWDTLRLK
jgi:hypothetical protein